jgi:hypothetical protein
MKKNLKFIFTIFLFVYFGFLIKHAIGELSLWMLPGIAIAILAHARKNSITLILLLAHMAIEWFEWGSNTVSSMILFGYIVHSLMDFLFLSHEIKVHFKKQPYYILLVVLISLGLIASFASKLSIEVEILETIHSFVLGGVIGCVGSHIYFHFTKEH